MKSCATCGGIARSEAAPAGGPAAVHTCAQLLAQLLAEQHALRVEVEAIHAHLVRKKAPAAPVAVAELLRKTHAAIKGDIWAVRDLRALGLLDWPMRNSKVGQILSAHADQVIEGFRLRRMTKRSTNEGQLYKIEAVDGDDLGSSSPGAVDTMQTLQLPWRTPR